jgi:hypothetical protein
MHPNDKEFGTPHNLASSAKNWQVSNIHDCGVEEVDKLRIRHELHPSHLIWSHIPKHVNVHLWE